MTCLLNLSLSSLKFTVHKAAAVFGQCVCVGGGVLKYRNHVQTLPVWLVFDGAQPPPPPPPPPVPSCRVAACSHTSRPQAPRRINTNPWVPTGDFVPEEMGCHLLREGGK